MLVTHLHTMVWRTKTKALYKGMLGIYIIVKWETMVIIDITPIEHNPYSKCYNHLLLHTYLANRPLCF